MPMRLIDLECPACGHRIIDHFQRSSSESLPLCANLTLVAADSLDGTVHTAPCLTPMRRAYLPTKRDNVIGDDIPGGIEIKHALCNPDGTPRRYYSKTEIAREAKKRGYTNVVTHVPSPGSDKNRWGHTTAWTSVPLDEATRLKHWHEHEDANFPKGSKQRLDANLSKGQKS